MYVYIYEVYSFTFNKVLVYHDKHTDRPTTKRD